jgi:hypothetical protein
MLHFGSCVNDTKIRELKQVDSISRIIKKAENKLHEVNRDSIGKKYQLYLAYSSMINEDFYKLKNEKSWPYICAYAKVKKPFRNMYNNYNDFQLNIDSAKVHLEYLKHDIRHELIDEAKFGLHYKAEMKEAVKMLDAITFRVDCAKRELANFDTVHPKIVSIVDAYKKKKIK